MAGLCVALSGTALTPATSAPAGAKPATGVRGTDPSVTFGFTGTPQPLTVPANAIVTITADGAGGADNTGTVCGFTGTGGTGGRVVTTLPPTSAPTTFTINVGSTGTAGCNGTGTAGYNGGGAGGTGGHNTGGNCVAAGAGGGGGGGYFGGGGGGASAPGNSGFGRAGGGGGGGGSSFATPTGTGTAYADSSIGTANKNGQVIVSYTVVTPSLTIAKTHTGKFVQGKRGTYTIEVGNTGPGATDGSTVTVTDTLPPGLIAHRIDGTGWNCTQATLTCTRSDVLAAGGSYPPITLKVKVSCDRDVAQEVTNKATVTGGGDSATHTANDPTTIKRNKHCRDDEHEPW